MNTALPSILLLQHPKLKAECPQYDALPGKVEEDNLGCQLHGSALSASEPLHTHYTNPCPTESRQPPLGNGFPFQGYQGQTLVWKLQP